MNSGRYKDLDMEDLPKNDVKKEYHDKKPNASKTKYTKGQRKAYESY
jgi:hypothetical protein